MSFIFLDFETFYAKGYSLRSMTYEQYIKDPRFKVHMVGIKIDNGQTKWYPHEKVKQVLTEIFYPGNDHILICHRALFDGSILSFYYGLYAAVYYCTERMCCALWNQESHSLENLAIKLWPNDPTKRKGDDLKLTYGIRDLTPELYEKLGVYCVQDIDLMFDAFAIMWRMFPEDELAVLDMTLQMYLRPGFQLNRKIVEDHLINVRAEKAEAVKNSGTNRTTLASGPKFVQYIKDTFGLDVPIIDAPTKKNPDNRKHTLSKAEITCINFINDNADDHPGLREAFAGRFAVASTLEESRAVRLLEHAEALPHKPDPTIAIPLNYAAAHTQRWGGTNKINGQNFGRGSPLRLALEAPEEYYTAVGDLAQIEVRVLAWWAGEEKLLQMFRNKEDIYSNYASKIYNRPINRKQEIPHPETGEPYKPHFIEGHVGKTTVLGLGFQMGPQKFKDTLAQGANGGPPVIMDFATCYHIVHGVYRKENPNIVQAWSECNKVIADMITLKQDESYEWRHLIVEKGRLRLPNGMYLNYPGLRWKENEETGYDEIVYWQGNYETKIYPGKLTENIIQALARIVIAAQMLKINAWLKAAGNDERVLLTVHDEIVALMLRLGIDERLDTMLQMMRQAPHWCPDLPLDAEGGFDVGYSK